MKIFLMMTCLISFCRIAISQVDTTLGDNYLFEEVYQCGDQTKEQLYEKSKTWVKRTLKSGDNLIEFDEEEKNTIIVSGNLLLESIKRPMVNSRTVNFKLTIYFKDGRVKYILDNIVHSCEVPITLDGEPPNRYNEPINNLQFTGLLNKEKLKRLVLESVDMELKKLLSNYKQYLVSNQTAEEGDW